jgi:hypothetical protein
MATKIILGFTALLIAAGAFLAGILVDRYLLSPIVSGLNPDTPPGKTNPAKTPNDPRREALIQYLDGKTIALKDSKTASDKNGTLHTIKKDQIEAVEFPKSMAKNSADPWRPQVTLILNTGEARYFVHCTVPYREVEQTFAFLGFEVTEVAKQ